MHSVKTLTLCAKVGSDIMAEHGRENFEI